MTELHTETLPLLPLTTGVVLPGMVVTLTIESPEAEAAVEAAAHGELILVPPASTGGTPGSGRSPRSRRKGASEAAWTPW